MSDMIQDTDFDNLPKEIKTRLLMLERMRRDFVANVSHELRTPLTVLKGYLETLVELEEIDVKSIKKIHLQMLQYSERMESIINDLLLLSSLEYEEHDVETLSRVDVPQIIGDVIQDARTISGDHAHDFQVDVEAGLRLHGSEKELKSLISNLIINAVKYTPSSGIVSVSWQKDGDYAVLSVADTGIGIDEKHLSRLTERFYRVDKGRSRASGGTGLGLAIVKHVLMRYNTELMIESKSGVGSRFICQFPINE